MLMWIITVDRLKESFKYKILDSVSFNDLATAEQRVHRIQAVSTFHFTAPASRLRDGKGWEGHSWDSLPN